MHKKFTNYSHDIFGSLPEVRALSSTKLSPFKDVERSENVNAARQLADQIEVDWFKELEIDRNYVCIINQVHGNSVQKVIKCGSHGKFDALTTNVKGNVLRIVSADCLPIFIYDKINSAIGLVHAGWRGLESKIISKTFSNMNMEYGSEPKNLIIAVGPFIKQCCYEVGEEVAEKFAKSHSKSKENGKYMLNLNMVLLDELKKNHIMVDNISIAKECTFCNNNMFFSARRGDSRANRSIHLFSLVKN